MTRRGTWKRVPRDESNGRLRNARDYLAAADELLDRSKPGANGNPIMSQALLAVIAYADALTIRHAGIQNTEDHANIAGTVEHALGAIAERDQVNRLRRLVSRKNDIQYDHRVATVLEASKYIEQAHRFASWAEELMARS